MLESRNSNIQRWNPCVERIEQIQEWLATCCPQPVTGLQPASADASFRRYLRAQCAGASYVVMDAPPAHEDVGPWLQVRTLLDDAGVAVPQLLAADHQRGFLLISDLGDATMLSALHNGADADALYSAATASLVAMQRIDAATRLATYDHAELLREMRLFPEWYVGAHLGVALDATQSAMLAATFEKIIAVNLAEERVFVHRDYHSRNLMLRQGGDGDIGVIDFQDAVYGPLSYDIVSLLKDAYIDWPEERRLDWLVRYWRRARDAGLPAPADFGEFFRHFEWMGVQRHIKVLGIFARLKHRDGKDSYLRDIPLVMQHLRQACARYDELQPLLRLLNQLEGRSPQVGFSF